jgi:hypothetical protein
MHCGTQCDSTPEASMDYSTTQAIPQLEAHGVHGANQASIRRLEKIGAFSARKNHRGEIILSHEDIERLAQTFLERRAAQHRMRQAAIKAAHAARRSQHRPAVA